VLVQVLRKAGIGYDQITPVYLAPPDAAAAFRQGAVDAWSIWDPFYAIAEADPETVVLTSALSVAPSNSFLLAGRGYAHANQATLAAVIAEVTKLTSWVATNQDVLAKTLSEVTGIPEPIQRVAAARGNYNTGLMTDAVAAQQQAIADTFFDLRLIPRPIRVADAVWHPSA
jgi:ABC-type nitrate/sulfonate/bicarbonate transport system substrate-binding protein